MDHQAKLGSMMQQLKSEVGSGGVAGTPPASDGAVGMAVAPTAASNMQSLNPGPTPPLKTSSVAPNPLSSSVSNVVPTRPQPLQQVMSVQLPAANNPNQPLSFDDLKAPSSTINAASNSAIAPVNLQHAMSVPAASIQASSGGQLPPLHSSSNGHASTLAGQGVQQSSAVESSAAAGTQLPASQANPKPVSPSSSYWQNLQGTNGASTQETGALPSVQPSTSMSMGPSPLDPAAVGDNSGNATLAKPDPNDDLESLGSVDEKAERDFITKPIDVQKLLFVARGKLFRSKLADSFIKYLSFMVIYLFVIISQRDARDSFETQSSVTNYIVGSQFRDPVSKEYKGWLDIVTEGDFWNWMDIHLVQNNFFVTQDQFGRTLPAEKQMYWTRHNKVTSGFRLVQRRVRADTCEFEGEEEFRPFADECYGRIYVDGMFGPTDKTKFGPGTVPGQSGPEFEYEEIDTGVLTDGGFFWNFPLDQTQAAADLNYLKNHTWIDKATSFIRLDITTFNPNVGMFTFAQFRLYLRNTGLNKPEFDAVTIKAAWYISNADNIRAAGEIFILLFWVWFIYDEIRQALDLRRKQGHLKSYFSGTLMKKIEFWQIILLFVVMIMWASIVTDPIRKEMNITSTAITQNGNQINLVNSTRLQNAYFVINGAFILISTVKLINFMRVNQTMSILTETMIRMAGDLFQFLVVFLILLVCFVCMGMVVFGGEFEGFKSFDWGIQTAIEMLLGNGDYFELRQISIAGAPVFYYPFVFVMTMVILNMLIAVIMDAYAAVLDDRKDVQVFSLWYQFKMGIARRMGRIGCFISAQQRAKFAMPTTAHIIEMLEPFEDIEKLTLQQLQQLLAQKGEFVEEDQLQSIYDRYCEVAEVSKPKGLIREMRRRNELNSRLDSLKTHMDKVMEQQLYVNARLDVLTQAVSGSANRGRGLLGQA